MSHVQITLFGALEVTHGDDPPQRPPTQKVLSLLGYLIANRSSPQSRAKLVALLWPDLAPRQARRMLSDALWRARRLLTPPGSNDTLLLSVEHDSVTFILNDDTDLDVAHFDTATEGISDDPMTFDLHTASSALLSNEEVEQLETAMQLYRGDFLEECFDDWAVIERERLRERYLGLIQRLLAHYLANSSYEQALHIALRLAHADPLREEAYRVLMRCYWLLGRTSDALRAYEQCCTILEEELGVAPEDATVTLYNEICRRREGESSPQANEPSYSGLPFVGRWAERAALLRAVEATIVGQGGVVLLSGEPGSGKSHLLREIASGVNWRGAEISAGFGREADQPVPFSPLRQVLSHILTAQRLQQLAVDTDRALHPLRLLLPKTLLDEAGRSEDGPWAVNAAGAKEQTQQLYEAIAATLRGISAATPQVVVLEDIHWFDTATLEALSYIVPRLQNERILFVLSGRSEELQTNEAIWQLLLHFDRSGLLLRVPLTTLTIEDCNELVRRALGMAHVPQRFSARLHSATGGNPFFVLETVRSLQEQGLLTRDARGGWHTPWDTPDTDYGELPLATNVRQIIDSRLQRLSERERSALIAAAVLGQHFTQGAWLRMLGHAPPVDELLRRSFLVETHDGYRFDHETLRETIYAQIGYQELQELHLRAAEALEDEHFAGVEALAQHFYQASAWDKAHPYLVQAGDRAVAVFSYRDALNRYDQALEAVACLPESETSTTYCDVQLKRAEVAVVLGNYAIVQTAYEQVLNHTEPVGRDPQRRKNRIQALNGLCYVLSLTNQFERAASISAEARALADAWPELRSRAATYYQAGTFCYHIDQYNDAQQHLQQALDLYVAIESAEGEARCLELLAWTWRRQEGVTDRVLWSLQQAMAIYTQQGDHYRQRHCTISLANVYLLRGALDQVLRLCDAVLPFFRSTDTRYAISECQYFRGVALLGLGRYDEALRANEEAFNISVELGIAAAAQVNQIFIGKALAALGRPQEAWEQLTEAAASQDRLVRPRALTALAELALATGQLQQASEYACTALHLLQMVGSQPFLGITLRVLGLVLAQSHEICRLSNELPDAESCFQQSIALLQTACLYRELALSLNAYGSFLIERGRGHEGKDALQRAAELLQHTNDAPAFAAGRASEMAR